MKLIELRDTLIELKLHYRRDIEINRYLDAGVCVIGRVKECRDSDGPPHIRIGSSVLPIDTQVERDEFFDRWVVQ